MSPASPTAPGRHPTVLVHAVRPGRDVVHQNVVAPVLVHAVRVGRDEVHQNPVAAW